MGTRYKGSIEETRALDTYIKLMRAADSVTARVHQHLADENITVSQLGVLEALYHLGPMIQRDIADKLLKSDGNITMVINNLEKNGFARRKRDTGDRRFITVHLTDRGTEMIKQLFPRHSKGICKEMKILSAKDQEILGNLCRRLGKREAD